MFAKVYQLWQPSWIMLTLEVSKLYMCIQWIISEKFIIVHLLVYEIFYKQTLVHRNKHRSSFPFQQWAIKTCFTIWSTSWNCFCHLYMPVKSVEKTFTWVTSTCARPQKHQSVWQVSPVRVRQTSQKAARQTTNGPQWEHAVRHGKDSDSLMSRKWKH